MNVGDSPFETWWNRLQPEQRMEVFRLIPLHRAEQIEVFSSRRWHELHSWMRDDLRKLFRTMTLALQVLTCGPGNGPSEAILFPRNAGSKLLSHFRAKGQLLGGILYSVISEEDRQAFPEVSQAYGIAVEELTSRQRGEAQYWLFASEAEYDNDVLLALSGVSLLSTDAFAQ